MIDRIGEPTFAAHVRPQPQPMRTLLLWIRCSWCGRVMREGDIGAPTTHGCCGECLARMKARTAAAKAGAGRA